MRFIVSLSFITIGKTIVVNLVAARTSMVINGNFVRASVETGIVNVVYDMLINNVNGGSRNMWRPTVFDHVLILLFQSSWLVNAAALDLHQLC
jgi:hypothetical protein